MPEEEPKLISTEVSSSFSGTLSTGKYANEKPFFHLKEVWMGEVDIDERQKILYEKCYKKFAECEQRSIVDRIMSERKDLRFYDIGGTKYPSVTSIIGWDKDFYISPESLLQHAARGFVIDKQVEVFLDTGEWKEAKDIPEIFPQLVVLKKGNLSLDFSEGKKFLDFYKEYPFKVIAQQEVIHNDEHQYAGRSEIQCIIESENKGKWEKVKDVKFDVPTLLDLKATTSLDKTYAMKQNTAYAKGLPDIQQIGVIHLKKDNKCGYAAPIIETNLDKYWSLFLKDRENFRYRFNA